MIFLRTARLQQKTAENKIHILGISRGLRFRLFNSDKV